MKARVLAQILKAIVPMGVRQTYRRLCLKREVNSRRESHLNFLRDEYFPYHFREIQKTCSRRLKEALEPLLLEFDPSSPQKAAVDVQWDGIPYDLLVRRNTSDVAVLIQVFHERQYAPALKTLQESPGAPFIDCGANIGLASRFFLDSLPDRKGVLIEPCPRNLAICHRNLAPYATSVEILSGAVSHTDGLAFDLTDPGLLEWGLQCVIRDGAAARKGSARTYTIGTLIRLLDKTPVGLVKIDIEGGEKDLFARGDSSWLSLVRNIAIEIHGDACASAVQEGLNGYSYGIESIGEITMFSDVRAS